MINSNNFNMEAVTRMTEIEIHNPEANRSRRY